MEHFVVVGEKLQSIAPIGPSGVAGPWLVEFVPLDGAVSNLSIPYFGVNHLAIGCSNIGQSGYLEVQSANVNVSDLGVFKLSTFEDLVHDVQLPCRWRGGTKSWRISMEPFT